MPVISFASSKGGAGKTTAAIALATQLAHRGVEVTLIDCDPEQWAFNWGQGAQEGGWLPQSMTVVAAPTNENDLPDMIESVQAKSAFVLLDLEGSANMAVGYSIASSDLVIIPMRASSMDAEAARKTMSLVGAQQKVQRRRIPMAVLFSATSLRTKMQGELVQGLKGANINVLTTSLVDRVAFREMIARSCPLESLGTDVTGVDKAIINAASFAGEVVTLLKEGRLPDPAEETEVVGSGA